MENTTSCENTQRGGNTANKSLEQRTLKHIRLMPKGVYLIDMDGVLFDYAGAFSRIWNDRYSSEGYPLLDASKQKHFYMEDNLPDEFRHLAGELVENDEYFFRNLEPIKGAIEGITALAEDNSVYICTSPNTKNDHCAQAKIYSVRKYLGDDWVKKTIITKDKTIVKANYLIDDKPEITGAFAKSWEHIMYDQPYNRKIKTDLRFSWQKGIFHRFYSGSEESELDKMHAESWQRYLHETGQISREEYKSNLRKLKFGIKINDNDQSKDTLENKLEYKRLDAMEQDVVWND